MSKVAMEVCNIDKEFGDITALDNVSIGFSSNEFFTLLGPSGSGKSTLLRIIAGLETPTSGVIKKDGREINHLDANERNSSLIFQDFALFPHKTVGENIAFPLKMADVDKKTRRQKAEEMLEFSNLSGYYDRYPTQLSGGEKQRIALARGLISEPDMVLLDEPLASLDRELRKELEIELRRFQRRTETTFVHVTHNQEEAMVISDRMCIINNGMIEQVGRPEELYENPATPFVGSFLGDTNKLYGDVSKHNGEKTVDASIDFPLHIGEAHRDFDTGERVEIQVKIEDCRIRNGKRRDNENVVSGELVDVIFEGDSYRYLIQPERDDELVADEFMVKSSKRNRADFEPGDTIEVAWDPDDMKMWRRS